ncbi:Periplasmic component of amino acid ABC-type transporter/signal transduction system [Hyella patelloides LEGE 07179]|uniref:Periplasmic component of amino acid ABC-type transporter/signal transduction system n=1 Tax=Hyella patelloides LEGE 07179 TaxID=945734 RepID=A0A563VWG4_9CYAN|nr:transporter substrate-binding domain-containing protein [Hyella patelloides]VEP15593.1 Periplasmic component of amino acid ABC-type transporter/signal transduction system [Hyella patelloides LEGE 07179]
MIRSRLFAILAIALLTFFSSYSGLSAAELEEIQRRGKLIVAVKDNTRPMGFIDDENNLTGLEIEIARRLAKDILGDEDAVVLRAVTNEERLKAVIYDEVDLTIARVSDTASRRRIVDLSPHYYIDGTGIITKDVTVANAEGLTTSKIAVLYGSTTIAILRDRLPDAQLIGVDSYQEALTLLENNQAQAFAGDITVLTGWIQEYSQYKLLPERLSGEPLSIVMPKGLQHKELQLAVYNAISDWRKSGWLQERIEYWGLP